jgi:methylphosphotriester-DNA--protein-cysteine methyltransferase
MVQYLTVERRDLDGFEGLQEAVKDTHFDILQIGRGKLHGRISYLGVGDLTLSLNSFNTGVCAQRTSADDKIMIGMLLSASDRVTQWSFDMIPGDIVVIPPQSEHHATHCGASSYAVIRIDPEELPSVFSGDTWLSDPENWQDKNRHRANSYVAAVTARGLSLLADHLSRLDAAVSDEVVEFWRRTIVECMAMTIKRALPAENGGHLPSALKLVRLVQDYLRTTNDRPLHISELCSTLSVSRRSLHRAFHEIFGIGPVTFLRQKRLCTVHSILKASSPAITTVGEVALRQGFVELGRFSHDYRVMFGEYPSQTLGCRANRAALRIDAVENLSELALNSAEVRHPMHRPARH